MKEKGHVKCRKDIPCPSRRAQCGHSPTLGGRRLQRASGAGFLVANGREVEERTLTLTSTPGSCSCSRILWSLQDLWIHTLAVNSLLPPMLPSLRRLNRFPACVCSCKHFQPPQFRFTFQTIGGATAASEHFSYLQPAYLQYL